MTRQADREASNALVANTGFYTAALARAHAESERHEATIELLRADKRTRDDELQRVRGENDNLQREVMRLQEQGAKDSGALLDMRRRLSDAERENTHLKDQIKKHAETEQTQHRALIESHNERDGLRKQLHKSGEALGFLKGEANAFVASLRSALDEAGYACASAREILDAIGDLVNRAGPKGPKPGPKTNPRQLAAGG
jgi:chromosome segregation ATPase